MPTRIENIIAQAASLSALPVPSDTSMEASRTELSNVDEAGGRRQSIGRLLSGRACASRHGSVERL